ncbi:hypothetical protein OsJ_14159 [Oryza sativa Japonica Group]|uniref:RING-type E3 ubiquitin transferase n=1 Tax=Oryza sativa subsp. japonica TaxID=39947 RepID=A3AS09_ORYSJ|nr:hypothetical protein OsJ_14159 [Oryza sativa Japonica Group]USH99986.1 zinc finger protein [Oryza sativa Japonica Group]
MASSSNPSNLPCSSDGVCMLCKVLTTEVEQLRCSTCATPWHTPCLSSIPPLTDVAHWVCPDCSGDVTASYPPSDVVRPESSLIAAIRVIEADPVLSIQEKARRRQELLGHAGDAGAAITEAVGENVEDSESNNPLSMLNKNINCSFCMLLPERPVTTPCGHNFCLKCFRRWIENGKRACVICRAPITQKVAQDLRINLALVQAIRMAKAANNASTTGETTVYHYKENEDKPDRAFTTERAKRAGMANASSGQIFVTIAPDYFGPILEDHDPRRNRGVRVGDHWKDRMEGRQWGAHFPHIAGIAGQSTHGAQSVALSGGYLDDEDHGEWFLYTGSGGRDLSGNKRTSKEQSFDQKFEKLNAALRVSCLNGYPVRVVRSFKEKRSPYAPESGVRYDGIYRIEKCWRKTGVQGTFKVCSDEHGDHPRPLPDIEELKNAIDITERKGNPAWDFDATDGWKWMITPPISRKAVVTGDPRGKKMQGAARHTNNLSMRERLLKEFRCSICRNVMEEPVTTPCAHNFCKKCLLGSYDNLSLTEERSRGGRTLRARKIVKKCPSCPSDIADFVQNPQVNRDIMNVIESLQKEAEKEDHARVSGEGSSAALVDSDDENDTAWENQDDGNLDEGGCNNPEDMITESVDLNSVTNVDNTENKVEVQQPHKRTAGAGKGKGGKWARTSSAPGDADARNVVTSTETLDGIAAENVADLVQIEDCTFTGVERADPNALEVDGKNMIPDFSEAEKVNPKQDQEVLP